MEDNLPVNVREYQELAKKALPKMHYDYISGGAEDEYTLRDNIAAYGRILYCSPHHLFSYSEPRSEVGPDLLAWIP
jgi:isopentenyl diphosphate isomerase/L-lactate dehydrogenase-like FMN-dependent dehydrogenase